jgi:hypothetical protein
VNAHHRNAVFTTVLAGAVVAAATAFVQATQTSTPRWFPAAASAPSTTHDAFSMIAVDDLLRRQLGAGAIDYSDYPSGAGGTSNGQLTAAEKGEPVGAAGTSGGSVSQIARTGRA